MKTRIPNALLVWKQIEDHLVPSLRLSTTDRAAYYHLLRHSRLEGKPRLRFSMYWIGRGMGLSRETAREAVRRLISLGVLRLLERTKAGHLVEVRLPDEIRAIRSNLLNARNPHHQTPAANLEELDFFKNAELRQAIHARERGLCFYCLRRTCARKRCIDHVVPRAKAGRNSYRNLVSSCLDCNSLKCDSSAPDLLSRLYRDGRLTAKELTGRLRALNDLASGKLCPALPT